MRNNPYQDIFKRRSNLPSTIPLGPQQHQSCWFMTLTNLIVGTADCVPRMIFSPISSKLGSAYSDRHHYTRDTFCPASSTSFLTDARLMVSRVFHVNFAFVSNSDRRRGIGLITINPRLLAYSRTVLLPCFDCTDKHG